MSCFAEYFMVEFVVESRPFLAYLVEYSWPIILIELLLTWDGFVDFLFELF